MKKLVIIIAAIFTAIPLFSQYSAGTLKVGIAVGNSPYVSSLGVPNQFSSSQTLSPVWNSGTGGDIANMAGMELKFFVADGLACKILGGGQFSMTPGQVDVEGTDLPFDPQTGIPTFNEVQEQKNYQYVVQIGSDFYVQKGNAAIYGGLMAGIRYSGRSSLSQADNSAGETVGMVLGQQYAINFGAEYGTQEGIFFGVEIRPISMEYTVSTIEPSPGVSFVGDNLTWGFFVYPTARIGINF